MKRTHVTASFLAVLIAIALVSGVPIFGDDTINITTPAIQRTISPRVNGMHFVYPMESDAIYEDGRIAQWARDNNIGTARFPGGTVVKFWNWDDPTGVFKGDRWDPDYDPANDVPEEFWMSLDEYLEFCERSGIEPLVGVNIHSGEVWNRREESAQRAKEMVEYTLSRGWNIRYWYLGNEDGFSAAQMADVVNAHADRMREANPDIRIIATKNKPATYRYYYNLMLAAGHNIDAVECHFKWGNPDGLSGLTFDQWRTQSPIGGGSVAANYTTMRNAVVDAGYPDTEIMINEWGPGRVITEQTGGFTKYTSSLAMVDFLVEIYRIGYDMAAYWNTQWNSNQEFEPRPDGHLLDSTNNYAFNPVARGFELLRTVRYQNQHVQNNRPSPLVYGFTTRNAESTKVEVFLMNKNTTARNLTINCTLLDITEADALAMVDPGDGLTEVAVNVVGPNRITLTLPPLSFTRISMTDPAYLPPGGQYIESRDLPGYRLGAVGPFVVMTDEVDAYTLWEQTFHRSYDPTWFYLDNTGNGTGYERLFARSNIGRFVKLEDSGEFDDQGSQWSLLPAPDPGWFYIRHRGSGRYVRREGLAVRLSSDSTGSGTQWRLVAE